MNWFWYRRTVRKIFLSNESPCLLGRERPFLDDWFCLYYDPDRPACWNRTFKKHGVAMCIYLLSQWTFPKHKRGAISYPLETIIVENNRKTAEDMGILYMGCQPCIYKYLLVSWEEFHSGVSLNDWQPSYRWRWYCWRFLDTAKRQNNL